MAVLPETTPVQATLGAWGFPLLETMEVTLLMLAEQVEAEHRQ